MKPDKVPNPSGVGTVEDWWGPSKKLLNDIKFLEGLQNYDKDNIPPAVMAKLMKTVMQDEGFVPEKIRTVSTAAEGTYCLLCPPFLTYRVSCPTKFRVIWWLNISYMNIDTLIYIVLDTVPDTGRIPEKSK